jgi:protein gp37
MFREQTRYKKNPAEVVRAAPATFNAPLRWSDPAKVFTCSWSDFFIEEADEWRDEAWDIIRRTPHLTYQILTKRPLNIESRLPADWDDGWPNVWLGVSVEREEYLWRAEKLIEIPSVIRFISYEPALGPVDFYDVFKQSEIHWLISGGESGPNARCAKSEWFEKVRDECHAADVAYFHKQNGGASKTAGHYGGNMLMGEVHRQFPNRTQQRHAVDLPSAPLRENH